MQLHKLDTITLLQQEALKDEEQATKSDIFDWKNISLKR